MTLTRATSGRKFSGVLPWYVSRLEAPRSSLDIETHRFRCPTLSRLFLVLTHCTKLDLSIFFCSWLTVAYETVLFVADTEIELVEVRSNMTDSFSRRKNFYEASSQTFSLQDDMEEPSRTFSFWWVESLFLSVVFRREE